MEKKFSLIAVEYVIAFNHGITEDGKLLCTDCISELDLKKCRFCGKFVKELVEEENKCSKCCKEFKESEVLFSTSGALQALSYNYSTYLRSSLETTYGSSPAQVYINTTTTTAD